jgi:hypothetical protein
MANREYKTIGMTLTTEQDIFEQGLNNNYEMVDIDYVFTGKTLVELYEKLKEFLGVEDDAFYVNESNGKLCATFMVNTRKESASASEIDQWKCHRIKLYSATYSFRVLRTDEVDLENHSELTTLLQG